MVGQYELGNPTCPICKHGIEVHTLVMKMGMTVCRVKGCKCIYTFDYSKKTLEEMR